MDSAQVVRLFRTKRARLTAFVRRILGSRAPEVEDATQETFVRLLQRYRDKALKQPEHLLFVIARNVCLDVLRRRKTRSRIEVPAMHEGEPVDVPDQQTPEQAHADMEMCQVIEDALQELPPRCRLAFILVENDGYDHAQAARALGVVEGSVRRYLKQAEDHCLAALKGYESGSARK